MRFREPSKIKVGQRYRYKGGTIYTISNSKVNPYDKRRRAWGFKEGQWDTEARILDSTFYTPI